jgi:hypothetical protein
MMNGATFGSGMVSQAFSLDGVDDFINVPDGAGLDVIEALSIDLWMKAPPVTNDQGAEIVDKGDYAFVGGAYTLRISAVESWDIPNAGPNLAGRVNFLIWIGDPSTYPNDTWHINSQSRVDDDAWHFIAATYDGAAMKLYVDGVLETTFSVSGSIRPTDLDLRLGCNSYTGGGCFRGLIDEVEIFDRAFSAGEVEALYSAGSAGKIKSGWKPDFAEPTNHPIVDFAILNGSLYAAADNKLYVKDGNNWNVIDAPAFVTSIATVNVTSHQPASVEWSRTYGGTDMDYAYDMIRTNDGGYALTGFTWSYGAGVYDFWLVKTDVSGNMEWNQTYGGVGEDIAYALVQTDDGGYALAGYTSSFGAGSWDMWLVKTDASGNMQWNQTYGGVHADRAFDLVQTIDGGYAMAGDTESYGSGIGEYYDFWLVKTDADGNAVWNRTYAGGTHDSAHSLIQTDDGGYALAGDAAYLGAGGADFWLVRTDADGNMLWNKTYGGAYHDWADALIQTDDDGYALTGTYSTGWGEYYFWLVKADSLGNMEWNRTYERTYGANSHALVQTNDGGYALAGEIFLVKSGQWDPDFWLIKTDASGNAQWNQTYGGIWAESAYSVVQTDDGNCALAGRSYSQENSYDFWLVKTESHDDPEERLVVGGKGGLYCYGGPSFDLIFSVPTYIKVLGVYNNTLYAGTMLDNPPKLYYCNGSADNSADWHIDTGFSAILNFSGAFGSIDSFWASNGNMGAPAGYWKFDEGAGSVAFDSSGNNFDGAVNGANWTDGILNKALEFDGQDDYVEVLDSTELNPPTITVAAWVNFKGFPEPGENGWRNSVIASKGTDVLVDGNYVLFTCAQFVDGAHMYFQIAEQGQYTYVGGNTIIVEDEWYYAVGTYDGSVLRVYVNGVLDSEAVLNTQRTSNTENLQIGAMRMLGNGYWTNGTIDEVKIYGYAKTPEEIWNDYFSGIGKMYVASGNSVYCYDGANWSVAVSYDDVSAFLAMKAYDCKLYLATRDQGWRKPLYQGGTGFSGRVIKFDGTSWTTVFDHDYWIYSLETYDNKLYVGTANKIYTFNGTDWETSFDAAEGAFYAISMTTYDGKVYVGMGNGYIFADPSPLKAEHETIVVPEFPSATILAIFMVLTMLAVALTRKKRTKRFC